MFENRLKFLLIVLGLPAIALVLRLVQLQVVRAGQYEDEAEHMLLKPAVFLPCLRGDITDHDGKTRLAYDAPSWNLAVHYRIIVKDRDYLRALARQKYGHTKSDQSDRELKKEIAASWQAIAEVTGASPADLESACRRILSDVARQKEAVSRRRKIQTVVMEEDMPHAVVTGLTQERQVVIRERLKPYEWVSIVADQTRQYTGGPAVGHLLGRLSKVSPQDRENDPHGDDELLSYSLNDWRGTSGIETLGEEWLRGRRGRTRKDIVDGRLVPHTVESRNGKNFRLTIDLPLQQELYASLQKTVEHTPLSTGGCVVLLDIPSRQIIAMVSYPSYDPNLPYEDVQALSEDEVRQPTLNRAIQMYYPPGSTVKPMLLAAALKDGTVTKDTRITCEGRLIAGFEGWRCTVAHGAMDPISALQQSCNVFFYTVGEQMGTPAITRWMSLFGLGRRSGTGLPQEAPGNLPIDQGHGAARLAGIGQGRLDVTPIQVANMIATVASGVYRPVTIWADDPDPRPANKLPIPDSVWRDVREGMFRVVNEPRGTAYEHARLTDAGDYILLGKTGSAEGRRRVAERRYTLRFPDGSGREETAASRRAMLERFPSAEITDQRPYHYWPPEGVDTPTHAWFTGYITSRSHYLESDNGNDLNVAMAVIVEYGGHGGAGAGPLALSIAKSVLRRQQAGVQAAAPAGASADDGLAPRSPVLQSAIRNSLSAINRGSP